MQNSSQYVNDRPRFAKLVLRRTGGGPHDHERIKTMEPIDHPPGREIERLNREIEEQYADAEWTPTSMIVLVLIALPFVAYGIHILVNAGVP